MTRFVTLIIVIIFVFVGLQYKPYKSEEERYDQMSVTITKCESYKYFYYCMANRGVSIQRMKAEYTKKMTQVEGS